MHGTLCFFLVPVRDIKKAKTFYRDVLGLEESWREGENTIAFKLPGSEVELMVDQIIEGGPEVPGPIFLVPSVDELYTSQKESIDFVSEPADTPDGRWVSAKDSSGNGLYFTDQSKAE